MMKKVEAECEYDENNDPNMEKDKRRRNDKEYENDEYEDEADETVVVKAGSKIASDWFTNLISFVNLNK